MTREASPTINEWRELYRAAINFRDLAPWRWMTDDQVFGVQDPNSGEVGYCTVLGALKEVFGLAIYVGTDGLAIYNHIVMGDLSRAEQFEMMAMMRGFTCLFGSREELQKEDLDIIKRLGLSFRGATAWPEMRSHRRHCAPWFLNSEEARYLTLALEQAANVALRVREDESLLDPPQDGVYLVRVPAIKSGELSWSDKWLPQQPDGQLDAREIPPDISQIGEKRIERILRKSRRTGAVVEVDVFHMPMPVKGSEDERPYYPQIVLWVDSMGPIIHFDLFEPDTRFLLQESLIRMLENTKQLPGEIHIVGKTNRLELASLTDRLGIRLANVRALKELPEAREALIMMGREKLLE